jgi:predicted transcriptional regulator
MFKQRVGELAIRPHIVPADATVAQACDAMARSGVSCLAAVRGARVVGFLTETNLVRHLDVDLEPTATIEDFLVRPTGSVPKDMPVNEVVKLLLERHERHLPVVDHGGSLLGLVTEKELVDALAVDFMVESAACRTLMRPDPVVVDMGASVRDALAVMRQTDAECLLVVAADRPVGMFSERDAITRIMGRQTLLNEPLSQHMTAPVISVPGEAMVYKVILYMRQKGVRRVAVVEASGKLAGLLTQRDILLYARRMS